MDGCGAHPNASAVGRFHLRIASQCLRWTSRSQFYRLALRTRRNVVRNAKICYLILMSNKQVLALTQEELTAVQSEHGVVIPGTRFDLFDQPDWSKELKIAIGYGGDAPLRARMIELINSGRNTSNDPPSYRIKVIE